MIRYEKKQLEEIISVSKSFRDFGKKIGVDGKTAKSIALRYELEYPHFKHNKIYKEMIGKKFNRLTIISLKGEKVKNKRKRIWAKCFCDCGKEKYILISSIRAGRTGSCGCDKSRYEKTRGCKSVLYTGYKEISGSLWKTISNRALKRGLIIDIDIEYAWELYLSQNRRCALSGLPILFGISNHKISETTASLDRIDSNKGYIKGNVQWVHKSINIMKNVLDNDVFINLCRKVYEYSHTEYIPDEKLIVNYFQKGC